MTQDKIELIKTALKDTDITAKGFNVLSLFSGLSPDDNINALRSWAGTKDLPPDAFNKAHRRWMIIEALGGYPSNVEEYVNLYVTKENITVRFNGLLDAPRAASVATYRDIVALGRDLRLLSAKMRLGFKDNRIADALDKWLCNSKQARLEAAFKSVCSDQPVCGDSDWLKLAGALADTSVISAHCAVRILQTTVWQVKRKLADDPAYPVHDHLMTILCGPQGCGKTQVTMKFFSPISDLVSFTNFTEITDGRNFDLWSYPVLFLDEMEAADRSDVEAIKNAITRSEKSGRALYTNSTNTVRVRSTCWGCTNGAVGDKIADPTGLRRFGPIHVKHAPTTANIANDLPVVDWDAINSIDYAALWQSVDHRASHPLRSDAAAFEEWTRLCEAERQQDSVEAWLRQLAPDYTHFHEDRRHTTGDLYRAGDGRGYADWCKVNGYGRAVVGLGKFGRRLSALSPMPWYPFSAPKNDKRGTVHTFKSADPIAFDGASEKVTRLVQPAKRRG